MVTDIVTVVSGLIFSLVTVFGNYHVVSIKRSQWKRNSIHMRYQTTYACINRHVHLLTSPAVGREGGVRGEVCAKKSH